MDAGQENGGKDEGKKREVHRVPMIYIICLHMYIIYICYIYIYIYSYVYMCFIFRFLSSSLRRIIYIFLTIHLKHKHIIIYTILYYNIAVYSLHSAFIITFFSLLILLIHNTLFHVSSNYILQTSNSTIQHHTRNHRSEPGL